LTWELLIELLQQVQLKSFYFHTSLPFLWLSWLNMNRTIFAKLSKNTAPLTSTSCRPFFLHSLITLVSHHFAACPKQTESLVDFPWIGADSNEQI
jgi:hypothetical protein